MSEIRLAIIGAGIIADAHLAAAAASKRVKIVAVVEPVQERRQALAQRAGATPFADLNALLQDKNARATVDAVLICTPPSIRRELVEAALKAGLPVMVEKPLAHCVAAKRPLLLAW